jgi:DnaJ family protein A protein 2
MTDYYNLLDLDKNASIDAIKKAYKQKALKCHPDRGGNEEEFKRVSAAYETLSDPQKKSVYDNGGQQQYNGGGMNHNDIFSQFFGNQGNQFGFNFQQQSKHKMNNSMYKINVSLADIHSGIKKNLKIHIKKTCFNCKNTCSVCNGSGMQQIRHQNGPFIQIINTPCNSCTTGVIFSKKTNCNCKEGTLEQENMILLDIPKGTKNNINFVYPNLGEQPVKKDDIPGDLLCQINTTDHTHFKRIGESLDLEMNISITFLESIIGKNVSIKHFDGLLDINTNIFGIINPNQKYIIYDKGLCNKGNLVILFNIDYPKNVVLTPESISLLKNIF